MQKELSCLFHNCLYFTTSSLARAMTRIAEEEFRITGMSPSYAFLQMLVNDSPGINQTELARQLNLTPSTVTRLIDKLEHRGYVERRTEGKNSEIHPTAAGRQLQDKIETAWHNLFQRYSAVLGEEEAEQLTQMIDQASQKLGGE
jgi:DNA-binding MarR family transcriptional regulator